MYYIKIRIHTEHDPPYVYIVDDNGLEVMEIFEEPKSHLGEFVEIKPNVWGWRGKWSWEPDDWQPGPLAAFVLSALNEQDPRA